MTEEQAKDWIARHCNVSRETWAKLERYVELLREGMNSQNLIAESTWTSVWARHIADSAQLLPLSGRADTGRWLDLGSGAGLPGIVTAILSNRPMLLVESRRLRVEFLQDVVERLHLTHVEVFGGRVEQVAAQHAAVISARAYAPLSRLLGSAVHLSGDKTLWLLPKGRNAQNELETARLAWQGAFHVERSVTDADSAIIVAQSVQRIVEAPRKDEK